MPETLDVVPNPADSSAAAPESLPGETQDTGEDTDNLANLKDLVDDPINTPFLTENSKLKASKAEHKKRVKVEAAKNGDSLGDNPNTGMSNAVVRKEIPIPIPSPRFTVFRSDATNPAQNSRRFYAYHNELPGWAKDRTTLYVYRDWPALKPVEENSGEFAYIDKISGNEPLQDDLDLLNRYGAGSYKLMFSEKTNLCTVYVVGLGLSDLKSHPPVDRRISDVSQVDMDFPGNRSYVEFLRMAGKLPEQQKGKEAELEMAAITMVETLQKRNDTLVDKALEAATKGARSVEPTQEAINKAIDVVADGAKKSNAMLTEAYQTVKGMREEGSSSSVEQLRATIELVKELMPKTGTGSGESISEEVRELRATIDRMRDERMAALEKQVAEARSNPPTQVSNGSPFASLKDGFAALREAREIVEEMSGGKDKDNPAEDLAKAAGAPAWLMPLLNIGLPIIGNIVQAVSVSRGLATPGPVIPTPQPQGGNPFQMGPQSAPPPPNNVAQMPQPGIPAPQGGVGAVAGPGASQGVPGGHQLPNYGLPQDVADLLWEIKTPFTTAVVSGDATGEDYADLFVGNYGPETFKQVIQFGPDGLLGAITNFPPIADRLNAMGIGLDRLRKFVVEFTEWKPEEGEGEGDGTGMGTGEGGANGAA